MSDDKDDFAHAAATMLDAIWKISKEQGFCPLCMVALMHDMVASAEEAGHIEHLGKAPGDDDEPEPTHRGPSTPQ